MASHVCILAIGKAFHLWPTHPVSRHASSCWLLCTCLGYLLPAGFCLPAAFSEACACCCKAPTRFWGQNSLRSSSVALLCSALFCLALSSALCSRGALVAQRMGDAQHVLVTTMSLKFPRDLLWDIEAGLYVGNVACVGCNFHAGCVDAPVN